MNGRCRVDRGARGRAGGRRLRVESRVAEGNLGTGCRQLHRARHAVQHRQSAQADARPSGRSRSATRRSFTPSRSTPVRRSSTAASSRASTASRSASSSTETRRTVLRRRRGLLAEAIRHLGPPRRAAARPDCLLDRRREVARPVHAVRVSANRSALDSRAGATS